MKNEHSAIVKLRDEMNIIRYSKSTIDSYCKCVDELLIFCKGTNPNRITKEQIKTFLHLKLEQSISSSYQNIYINALNLWQHKVYGRKRVNYNSLRPKKSKILPKPISKEEIRNGFERIINIKHRAMCMMLYTCGLRREELINCKLSWFNKYDKILIVTGKGNKQRILPYNQELQECLIDYYKQYKPDDILFKGQSNEKYSFASLYKVTYKYFNCSPHQLRHSFATHLIDAGVDINTIKDLMGHEDIRTTQVYIKVSTETKRKITLSVLNKDTKILT